MSDTPQVLKSSADWQKLVEDRYVIRDPDGWDRSNFSISWAELINFEEFEDRAHRSTIQYTPEFVQMMRDTYL